MKRQKCCEYILNTTNVTNTQKRKRNYTSTAKCAYIVDYNESMDSFGEIGMPNEFE